MDVKVNKKARLTTRDELQSLSKEELVEKVIQLEAHNKQLKCIVQKKLPQRENINSKSGTKRPFDFSKCPKRHILLRFFYLGWNYQGFAAQEDSLDTIEHHVFAALEKVCLIESREKSNYNRCGRTDKGVSAFHQVISLDVRSRFYPHEQLDSDKLAAELNYCAMLNRVLPDEIRCLAWMPIVDPRYSARFDCRSRTYRYFFPRGNLNISAMEEAARYMLGSHDFRNFCKMDVGNGVVNFSRRIEEIGIHPSQADTSAVPSYDMMYLQLRGNAFLWHQVRCIMGVLLLVGQGEEAPTVVQELLDVEKNPCKPQYNMAIDLPLNLYDCQFNDFVSACGTGSKIKEGRDWIYKDADLLRTITELQGHWTKHSVKTTMIREMLASLNDELRVQFATLGFIAKQADSLIQGVRSSVYCPLLERKRCESLENRIEHYAKKRRIEVNVKSMESRSADSLNESGTIMPTNSDTESE